MMNGIKKRLSKLNVLVTGLVASLFLFAGLADADPRLIQVEGATPAQLQKVRSAFEKAAYGPSVAAAPAKDDACEFYKPPQKLRFLKRLPEVDRCQDEKGSTILADSGTATLYLCKDGVTVGDYDFSMGREGTGKRIEGDKKTPLGKYPISRPVSSNKFKVFIPIGYPTPEQGRQGYTGNDIGIHGPSRNFRCAGFLNVIVDWTQGCLAVSSDILVKEIARFVEANNVRSITIN